MAIALLVHRTVGLAEKPDPWVHDQGRAVRAEGFSDWVDLPDVLASIPGVVEELSAHWVLGRPVKYARLLAGGWLVAVWDQRGSFHNDYVWLYEVHPEASRPVGLPDGAPPPGAPPVGPLETPAGDAAEDPPPVPGDPLARLRALLRRTRLRGL